MNKTIKAVLTMAKISPDNLSNIRMVDLLQGYVKLLTTKDSLLAVLLQDKNDINEIKKEIEKGRKFFQNKNLDLDLIKKSLSLVATYLRNGVSEGWNTPQYTENLLKAPAIATDTVLTDIINETGLPVDTFAIGATFDDVLAFQKKMIEEAKEKEVQNQENNSNALEEDAEKQELDELKTNIIGEDAESPAQEPKNLLALSKQYKELREKLLDQVKGQDGPVHEFVQGLFQSEILEEKERRHPKAVFLFVGPPGVGKTFLAITAVKQLGLPYDVYNMSEYAKGDYIDLIGTPQQYSNAREGKLVKFVREHPQAVLIFDEIEKADRDVIQLFLQILDSASLGNAYREDKTDFSNTTIIFTSNAGATIYENENGEVSKTPKNVIMKALQNEKNPTTGVLVFPQAICSRLAAGNVIMLNHLNLTTKLKMIRDHFAKIASKVKDELGYELSIAPEIPLLFMLHYGKNLDARIIAQQSENFIKKEIFELARQLESHNELLKDVKRIALRVELDTKNLDTEIEGLFNHSEAVQFAIVCKPEDKEKFVSSDKCRMLFADSEEELHKLLQGQVAAVFVDPLFGFTEKSVRGIAIDDYKTEGINLIDKVLETKDSPLFLIESSKKIVETDANTFYRKGAASLLSIQGKDTDTITNVMSSKANEIQTEEKIQKFIRRGNVIDFNTAQKAEQGTLQIIYHSLKKKLAIDADDASSFLSDSERPDTQFSDVIGAADAKEELQYFTEYLKNPRGFVQRGGKPPKGVLLYGPPGTGKTMLARAMAGESKMAFLQTSAAEFSSQWYGVAEEKVRNLFSKAKKYAPAVIFIDEIDAIGKRRNEIDHQGAKVLNTLLTEMDGFEVNLKNPIFVLAATNLKDSLDEALLRRFDNKIYVDLPNEEERLEYLKIATEQKEFIEISEALLKNVAARTTGLSIALLQNIVELAKRNAEKQNSKPTGQDLQNAVEEYNYGQKHEWSQEYYDQVAIHESGHAYIAYLSGEKPSYMTIVSRGDFGGYMQHENTEKKPNYTKEELLWKIRCALAGRAAEKVFEDLFSKEIADYKIGDYLNTGVGSDLQSATNCAAKMICEYGMFDGFQTAIPFQQLLSSPLGPQYVEKINDLLTSEAENTRKLIEKGREKVKRLADELLKKNHLTGDEIDNILKPQE